MLVGLKGTELTQLASLLQTVSCTYELNPRSIIALLLFIAVNYAEKFLLLDKPFLYTENIYHVSKL